MNGGAVCRSALSLSADPFSALFILIISLLSLAASVLPSVMSGNTKAGKILPRWVFYHAFILAMLLVVTVQNAFYFLLLGAYVPRLLFSCDL